MAINALNKLAAEVSDIPVKELDGSPMLDGANPVTATVFGPATKVWQVANSARQRAAMRRVREGGGKLEAAGDNRDDNLEFLCKVVKRFNGLALDDAPDQVRAILSHPQLGYIFDQLENDTRNWENFIVASPTPAASTPATLAG